VFVHASLHMHVRRHLEFSDRLQKQIFSAVFYAHRMNTTTKAFKGFREPQTLCMKNKVSGTVTSGCVCYTNKSATANTIHTQIHNNFAACSYLLSVVELS